jgi:hypothetical protein
LNPGFETAANSTADAANWTEGANHTRASDKFHTGGWSLHSTFRGSGTSTRSAAPIVVSPNTTYTYSGYIWRKNSTGGACLDMRDIVGERQLCTRRTGRWQFLSGTWNSGSNTSVTLRLITDGSPTGDIWFDDISLTVPGSAPTATSTPAGPTNTPIKTSTPTQVSTPTSTVASTATPRVSGVTYYVEAATGNDNHSCAQAQNPSTPKKTVASVMTCNPGPGETVRFRGEFKETIFPNRSGTVLYNVQDIAQVNGSEVTFNQTLANLNPTTDYVAIYGSRKGNSGAFALLSASGNQVTVDTSSLPGGKFLNETAAEPGSLQAALLRPVHFTAWDKNNPPVFNTGYQVYKAVNQRVILVSYLKAISGAGYSVWPAFEVDGSNGGNSDFQIFDHLEISNAESAISTEANEFQSNYDILQYNNIHDVGMAGGAMDELIYWGHWGRPDLNHNFVQIMYNKIGPHRSGSLGDGIDIKQSVENATIFGNELVGLIPQGCADAPMKIAGIQAFIANNYLHDIHNPNAPGGCGISITDDEPLDPAQGGTGAIVVNNIVANINGPGIKVVDTSNVQILNNTIYNILPEPGCSAGAHCMEFSAGILLHNWQAPLQNVRIQNNLVQKAHIGIGRYIGSHEEFPLSIESDYNLVFEALYPFRGSILKNAHDLVVDPGLVSPQNYNFALNVTSPARDSGTDLTHIFGIDNHDAIDPGLATMIVPLLRISPWNRGAFEY